MKLTEGPIHSHVRRIAIPASLGFFFNTMFNVVDTFFAGKISTDALAALSINFPIFFIILSFVNGLSTGGSALISNAIGEKNDLQARRLSIQLIFFAAFCYLIIAPAGIFLSPSLFRLLDAKGEYLILAITYMQIIFSGALFFLLVYSINAILLAHGNSLCLRNFLVAGFILNCILDPWFLWGGFGLPAMGFPGIAIATILVMALGVVYIGYEVYRQGYLSNLGIEELRPSLKTFGTIAQQCIPASMNMMLIGSGIFVIIYYVKFFGEPAVAAYGITTRIEQLALLPSIGLTIAALAIIGQNSGARQYARIQETIAVTLKYSMLIMGVGAFCMVYFGEFLMGLFTKDSEVISIGVTYLLFAAATSWAYMLLAIHIAAMQGIKRPYYALWVNLTRQLIVPILFFQIAVVHLGYSLESIWWGVLIITWAAALITVVYVRYTLRQKLAASQTPDCDPNPPLNLPK